MSDDVNDVVGTAGQSVGNQQVKKNRKPYLMVFVIFLVLGMAGGAIAGWFITRDDGFYLLGESEITIAVGQNFTDDGFNLVSFGRDRRDTVAVTGEVDTAEPGRHYIVYTTTDFRFRNVQRIRVVIVEAV